MQQQHKYRVATCGEGFDGAVDVLGLRVVHEYGPTAGRPRPFDLLLANRRDGYRDEGIDMALRVIEVRCPRGALLVGRDLDNYERMRLAMLGYEADEDAGFTLVERPNDADTRKALIHVADALVSGAR